MTYVSNYFRQDSDKLFFIDVIISLTQGLAGYENRTLDLNSGRYINQSILKDLRSGSSEFVNDTNFTNVTLDEENLEYLLGYYIGTIETFLIKTNNKTIQEYLNTN